MTTKERFLATVRERLTDGIPENALRPLAPVDDAPIRYAVDTSDPVRRFVEAAGGVGAEIVGRRDDPVEDVLAETARRVKPRTAALSGDPECAGVAQILESFGIEVVSRDDSPNVATADLGVTGARFGIALTGSLVMDSGRSRTRLASLLPPVHLALLPEEAILPTVGHLLRDLPRHLPEGLPSNLVLITGPSRSADIELQLTIGVHGPRRLLIALR